jgi:hypothetical protein
VPGFSGPNPRDDTERSNCIPLRKAAGDPNLPIDRGHLAVKENFIPFPDILVFQWFATMFFETRHLSVIFLDLTEIIAFDAVREWEKGYASISMPCSGSGPEQ